jgi:peptide/nickel transport system ATP-binding protein/oligopeptide transport system ATP-binding protein
MSLLEVRELSVEFRLQGGAARALDGVSLEVRAGEMLGVVGESGSGKSVTALSVMRLLPSPPGRVVGGQILFEGRDLLTVPDPEMRSLRGGAIAMVFQDPLSSLNPVLTVGFQVAEAIALHQRVGRAEAWERAVAALRRVRIRDPEMKARQYPHQLSGGQRQRVMIAMAFSCQPRLVIADEPTTALDVTVQRQILLLMRRLRREFGTAIMLITHDLGVVAQTCDRVAVMYAGRVVETAPVAELFAHPRHPYTQALLASVPRIATGDGRTERRGDGETGGRGDRPAVRLPTIAGQPPDLLSIPSGCPFRPRCPDAQAECEVMPGAHIFGPDQWVRCWNYPPNGE